MKAPSFVILLSASAAIVAAQSPSTTASSAAPTPSAANSTPLIPSSISPLCHDFLHSFNENSQLKKCLPPLLSITSRYAPGQNSSASPGEVSATLSQLCSPSLGCDSAFIKQQLMDFYQACKGELQGPGVNEVIKTTFDVLYLVSPMRDAICTKNDDKEWCVLTTVKKYKPTLQHILGALDQRSSVELALDNIAVPRYTDADLPYGVPPNIPPADSPPPEAPSPTSSSEPTPSSLSRRAPAPDASPSTSPFLQPNTTAWSASSLPYLFTLPTLDAGQLCTPCTKAILSAYLKWEMQFPYAMSLRHSLILNGQIELWKAIRNKCGEDFTDAILNVADPLFLMDVSGGNKRATTTATGIVLGSLIAILLSVALK